MERTLTDVELRTASEDEEHVEHLVVVRIRVADSEAVDGASDMRAGRPFLDATDLVPFVILHHSRGDAFCRVVDVIRAAPVEAIGGEHLRDRVIVELPNGE